jgi:hypothetical protein
VADFASVSLTQALARVWAAIRHYHPQVPEVVLLPVPNPHGHRGVLGHFAALRWTPRAGKTGARIHEVVVVAEHLDRTAEDVVGTLLHEAAHALNFERGIRDCSRSQYHNQQFRVAAEEVGLTVQQVPHYGFALTALLPETATRYAVETAGLSVVLMHRRDVDTRASTPFGGDTPTGAAGEEGVDAKSGRYKKASCACPWNIRVARATLAATVIRCETCGEAFSLAS